LPVVHRLAPRAVAGARDSAKARQGHDDSTRAALGLGDLKAHEGDPISLPWTSLAGW